MNIKEFYNKVSFAHLDLMRSGMRGIIGASRHSFSRSPYVESLLKHPVLPKYFGESFDEIMDPTYCIEDAKANIRFTELGRSQPEIALLSERAHLQRSAITALLDDAKEWIEAAFLSFKHQGNLEAFGRGFKEYFEKDGQYDHSWHRIVTAMKTFLEEELLPKYPQSQKLKKYCDSIASMLDADRSPTSKTEQEKITKQWDELQWYFDNFCYGSEPIVIVEVEGIPVEKQPQQPVGLPKMHVQDSPAGAVFACDGQLMALPYGSVYKNENRIEDVEPCVGQTLYALLKKKIGYVSYLDIARCIYGEKTLEPAKGRKGAIRRYVSTLKRLLKSYFPDCKVENERGKGWTFKEQVREKTAIM